jgi:hypothetical protein
VTERNGGKVKGFSESSEQPAREIDRKSGHPDPTATGFLFTVDLAFGQKRYFWTGTIPRLRAYRCPHPSTDCASMDWPDYLRDQATMYQQLAEQTDDPAVQNEMLELASVCEEVANNMEDHLTGG